MAKRDYYEVLGVDKSADADEIKRAYRRLAREYHPDVNKSEDAEDKFKEINEAYTVLSDNQKRTMYDQYGHAGVSDNGGQTSVRMDDIFGGIGDIFDSFFGGGFRGAGSTAENGRDIRYDLTISLQTALQESVHEIEVNRMQTCEECNGSGAKPGTTPIICTECSGSGYVRYVRQTLLGAISQSAPCAKCSGTGRIIKDPCIKCFGRKVSQETVSLQVKVPAGVEDGISLRLSKQGDAGKDGGRPGDLYVVVHIEQDERLRRDGTELSLVQPVSFVKAALGGKVKIHGLDGEHVITLKPGTQPGNEFIVKNAGMPPLGGGTRGALHVFITIDVPKKLNQKQQELLLQYAEAGQEDIEGASDTADKSFFEKVKDKLLGE